MLFNSMKYAIFLPIVFILYWLIPQKFKWTLMLIASYYFYMSWNVKFVVLILFTTVVSYATALFISKTKVQRCKKILLISALVSCFGVLFFFKYFNFFFDTLTDALKVFTIQLHPLTLSLILPVGISFYTFQTLSYTIDVYKGDIEAEPHFGKYATFISFFPQLVAGPIERAGNLLPQIKQEHFFSYDNATYGLKFIAWGLFKKTIIADSLAVYVNLVYNNVNAYTGLSLIIATVFFAFQIYCDFSGYSDIAIGSAKLFGIDLMTNFKSPYFAASIKEFWSRWHISLSTWFKDYVYIPLGGNRVGKSRHKLNLMITFLISGLWHGANWTFIIWGAINGLAQILEAPFVSKQSKKSPMLAGFHLSWAIRVIVVFTFCCLAWVLFRANNISDALYVFRHMLDGISHPLTYIRSGPLALLMEKQHMIIIVFEIALLVTYDYFSLRYDVIRCISKLPLIVRWGIYILLTLLCLLLNPAEAENAFIYFQF
jgi:D-alanyl-lipoteichoic acid acyltransferase DltB (MBOAT superfamily)